MVINNQYVLFHHKHKIWLIQTCFYDHGTQLTYKFINIDDLEFSNFSSIEIQNIKEALTKGVRAKLDFTNISPVLHPINHYQNEFEKNFTKMKDVNPNFNPDSFLNLSPLKI